MKEISYNIKVIFYFKEMKMFSLPDGASNKLFRTKMFKKILSIDRVFFFKKVLTNIILV